MKAQGITSYTVGVLGSELPGRIAALLTSMAALGGGKYFPTTDYSQLEIALQTIFSEVLSYNSVFTSVSLPVSVNAEGTYLNQVYVGMFRPDPDALPRWVGNLKQYKLGLVNNNLQTQDADGVTRSARQGPALSQSAHAATGRRLRWTLTGHSSLKTTASRWPIRMPPTIRMGTLLKRAHMPTSCGA